MGKTLFEIFPNRPVIENKHKHFTAAINLLYDQFASTRINPFSTKVAVFLVDGSPNSGNTDVLGAVNALTTSTDVVLLSIGLSTYATRGDLMVLSSSPQQQNTNWFSAQAYWALGDVQPDVIRALRSVQPVRQPEPSTFYLKLLKFLLFISKAKKNKTSKCSFFDLTFGPLYYAKRHDYKTK